MTEQRYRGRVNDLIEDVEFMINTAESVPVIATRTGLNPNALEKRLIRAGRRDLGKLFARKTLR